VQVKQPPVCASSPLCYTSTLSLATNPNPFSVSGQAGSRGGLATTLVAGVTLAVLGPAMPVRPPFPHGSRNANLTSTPGAVPLRCTSCLHAAPLTLNHGGWG
jgi:hypothetical protein